MKMINCLKLRTEKSNNKFSIQKQTVILKLCLIFGKNNVNIIKRKIINFKSQNRYF